METSTIIAVFAVALVISLFATFIAFAFTVCAVLKKSEVQPEHPPSPRTQDTSAIYLVAPCHVFIEKEEDLPCLTKPRKTI